MAKAVRLSVLATIFLLLIFFANSQEIRKEFVGKDACSPELARHPFNIRLDKTRNVYLAQRNVAGKDTLMIVQYAGPTDKCGVVRDIVQPRNAKAAFEINCVISRSPKEVVVGAASRRKVNSWYPAKESWRVDTEKLSFIPTTGARCKPESYSGNDEGDDLVTQARARAAKPKHKNSTKQN